MDKTNGESQKTVKLTVQQLAAYKFWIKDVTGEKVALATNVHLNTIYRVSATGHGSKDTIDSITTHMPDKYLKVAEVMGAVATA